MFVGSGINPEYFTPILPYSHTTILPDGLHNLIVNRHCKSNASSFYTYHSLHPHFDLIIIHQHADRTAYK